METCFWVAVYTSAAFIVSLVVAFETEFVDSPFWECVHEIALFAAVLGSAIAPATILIFIASVVRVFL